MCAYINMLRPTEGCYELYTMICACLSEYTNFIKKVHYIHVADVPFHRIVYPKQL